jgi:hypothetical protein
MGDIEAVKHAITYVRTLTGRNVIVDADALALVLAVAEAAVRYVGHFDECDTEPETHQMEASYHMDALTTAVAALRGGEGDHAR